MGLYSFYQEPLRSDELYHHGIKGQKWGVRRYQNKDGTRTSAGKRNYVSTSPGAIVARRRNQKVDKSFAKWKEGAANREKAISLGKTANVKRLEYEANKNRDTKSAYKQARKEYKQALKANTTYRKGQVKRKVGSDMSRKQLSKAKAIDKQLRNDPTNKALQKQYTKAMNRHDIERYKASKVEQKYANRSRQIANLRRARTVAVKAAITSAAVGGGTYAANRYLKKHGKQPITANHVRTVANTAMNVMKFI